jgi:hypothetical protein
VEIAIAFVVEVVDRQDLSVEEYETNQKEVGYETQSDTGGCVGGKH